MSPFVLNLFKPVGWSSFQVVNFFKKKFKGSVRKIGHFGTLDPFACGVLAIGGNGAMKLMDIVHQEFPKTYLAQGKLGIKSNSGDLTGELEEVNYASHLKALTLEQLNALFQEKFIGEYWQSPPAFSAAKYQGKALYQWAREGKEIKKEPKRREIYALEVLRFKFPYLLFRVTVSSGTYIRTLFEDMAQTLETGGTLWSLMREQIAKFSYKSSVHKSFWKDSCIRDLSEFLPFESVELTSEQQKSFLNGRREPLVRPSHQPYYWLKGSEQQFLGLARQQHKKLIPFLSF